MSRLRSQFSSSSPSVPLRSYKLRPGALLSLLLIFSLSASNLSTAAAAVTIVEAVYTHKFRTVHELSTFSVVTLSVTFDQDLLLGSTSVSELSYAGGNSSNPVICLNEDVCSPLPTATSTLLGALSLSCLTSGGESVLIDSSWSNAAAGLNGWPISRVPGFLIAFAGLFDATSALFHSMRLLSIPDIARSPRTISALLFLSLSDKNGPVPLRRSTLAIGDLSTCIISINGTRASLLSASDRRPVVADSKALKFLPRKLPCVSSESRKASSDLRQAIEVTAVNSWQDFQRAPWSIAAFAAKDQFWGCEVLAKSLVNVTRAPLPFNYSACVWVPSAPQWAKDPCCNLTLSYTMCCVSRASQMYGEVLPLEQPKDSSALAQCRFLDNVKPALASMGALLNVAESKETGCTAQISESVNQGIYNSFFDFVQVCNNRLLPGGTLTADFDPQILLDNVPTCQTQADCGPGIACKDNMCRIPIFTDLLDDLYWKCLVEQMPKIVRLFFQIQFQLAPGSSDALFLSTFRSKMFDMNCVGGIPAWQLNHDFSSDPPRYRLANQTQCKAYTTCSQDLFVADPNEENCPSKDDIGVGSFCAYCLGGGAPCEWIFPEHAGCWLSTGDYNYCASINGQFSGRLGGCWLANVTQTECLVPSICPVPNPTATIYTACSESLCYSPSVTQSQCNDVAITPANLTCSSNITTPLTSPLSQWRATWASGRGLCIHPDRKTKATCTAAGKTWWAGKKWFRGILDTQPKCNSGICVTATAALPEKNATECVKHRECTVACQTCDSYARRSGNAVCYSTCTNALKCSLDGGTLDKDSGLCVFAVGGNKTLCLSRGLRFTACGDVPVAQCAACDPLVTGTCGALTLAESKYLRCGIPERPFPCTDQATCEASGTCGDVYTFVNPGLDPWYCGFYTYGFFPDADCRGVCVDTFKVGPLGEAHCADSPDITSTDLGCVDGAFPSKIACEAQPNHRWVTNPVTQQQCTAAGGGSACFEPGRAQPSQKDSTQCAACSNAKLPNQYRPRLPWNAGLWDSAYMEKATFKWIPMGPVKPLRWDLSLNLTRFQQSIKDMAADRFAPFMKTELLCRYNTLASALAPVSCSCDAGGPDRCFGGTVSEIVVGEPRFCRGIAERVRLGYVSLAVTEFTVPFVRGTGCMSFAVSLVSAPQFMRVAALSSTEISSIQRVGGSYSVISNANGVTVGQLFSDGIEIVWTEDVARLSDTLTVCVDSGSVRVEASDFVQLDFALLKTAASAAADTASFIPMNANVTVVGGQLCVDVMQGGTYFAIRRIRNWESARAVSTQSQLAVRIVLAIEAGLFGLLCAFALFSFALALRYARGAWYVASPQKIILFLITEFAALRCVWLALNAAEATSLVSGVGVSILSELPLFTTYTIFTTLIVFWISSVGASSTGKRFSTKSMAIPILGLNLALYVFYAGMLIGFSFSSAQDKIRISIAYKVVLALLSVITAAAFWVSSARLMLLLKQGEDPQRKSQRIHMTVVVAVASMCLVGQVAFMLSGATISSSQQQIFALVTVYMFYILVELVPISLLCHMLFGIAQRNRIATVRMIGGNGTPTISNASSASLVVQELDEPNSRQKQSGQGWSSVSQDIPLE